MAKILDLTDGTFADQVFRSEQPVLVEFWAPWCKPCLTQVPVLQEIARDMTGELRVVRLNVDENPMATTLYGIRSIPSLLLFRQEEELEKFVGYTSKEELTERIAAVLSLDE